MKSKLLVFGIGIVIGLGAAQWYIGKNEALPVSQKLENPAQSLSENCSIETAANSAGCSVDSVGLSQSQSVPSSESIKIKSVAEKPSVYRKVEFSGSDPYALNLNHMMVNRLEEEKDSLRDYARTTRTAEGWKIELLEGDQVFARAGIRNGDFIAYQSLKSQMNDPEQAQLAQRFSEILDWIER